MTLRISELTAQLIDQLEKHGDLPVVVDDEGEVVNSIRYTRDVDTDHEVRPAIVLFRGDPLGQNLGD